MYLIIYLMIGELASLLCSLVYFAVSFVLMMFTLLFVFVCFESLRGAWGRASGADGFLFARDASRRIAGSLRRIVQYSTISIV